MIVHRVSDCGGFTAYCFIVYNAILLKGFCAYICNLVVYLFFYKQVQLIERYPESFFILWEHVDDWLIAVLIFYEFMSKYP
jgi:hypothetical protein